MSVAAQCNEVTNKVPRMFMKSNKLNMTAKQYEILFYYFHSHLPNVSETCLNCDARNIIGII